MQKQETIKDKEKLFTKLFISPSYNEPLDPPLLVSPDFIALFLEESSHASTEYQLSLIDDILNIFAQRPTNSMLLCIHDQIKLDADRCIADSIALRLLHLITTEEQIDLYTERMKLLLAYYRIGLRNIQKLTQYLSKKVFEEIFDPIKFLFVVKLLKLYYAPKLAESKSPLHYFYLFGNENTGIEPVLNSVDSLPAFKNELAISLSFNSQGEYERPYNLFLLKTEKKEEIGLTFFNGTLKITSLKDGKYLDEFIVVKEKLFDQVWYRVIVNLGTSETECIIGDQVYKGKALIRKDKERKIVGAIFGREFFGMLGSVFVSDKIIPNEKFSNAIFPYGIDNIDHIKQFSKAISASNILLSCLPFCTFQIREINHCFDIFKKNHSTISDNIIVVKEPIREDNIEHLGGCCLLLPLFYLVRFYDIGSCGLEEILELLGEIMRNYDRHKLEAEMEEFGFIPIFGQHLSDLTPYQSRKSINLLLKIYFCLENKNNKMAFIHDVFWSLKIGIGHNFESEEEEEVEREEIKSGTIFGSKISKKHSAAEEILSLYYQTLLDLLVSEPEIATKAMSFTEAIYWVVQNIEVSQGVSFYCCVQHYLNETVLSETSPDELVKLNASLIKSHYFYLEEILSTYLANIIQNNSVEIISESFKTLFRLTMQKYSSCFYLMILKVIRRQIVTFGKGKLEKIFNDSKFDLISFLAFLSEKTINPDIITETVFIALSFSRFHDKKRQQASKFVVNLLKINQQIAAKNVNESKKLSIKTRKNSLTSFFPVKGSISHLSRSKSFNHFPLMKIPTQNYSNPPSLQSLPRPEKLSSFSPFYNLILNQASNTNKISTDEPLPSTIESSHESLTILMEYYKVAQSIFKQSILLYILSSLENEPQLKHCQSLVIFLLEGFKDSIHDCQEEFRSLLTIFTCVFSQLISEHSSIITYYSSLKFSKQYQSIVSEILPQILPKVIKLADINQLSELMLISFYELTECKELSAINISQIVLGEIGGKILSDWSKGKGKLRGFGEEEFYNMSICDGYDLGLEDPFNEERECSSPSLSREEEKSSEISPTEKPRKFQQEELENFDFSGEKEKNEREDKSSAVYPKLQSKEKGKKLNSILKLSALEMYIKLFFKNKEKVFDNKNTLEPERIEEEKGTHKKERRNSETNAVYELKNEESLKREFLQVLTIYFNNVLQITEKESISHAKHILTYLLYKIHTCSLTSNQNVQVIEIMENIFLTSVLPLINDPELFDQIDKRSVSHTLISYFMAYPLKYSQGHFTLWSQDKKSMEVEFNINILSELFVDNENLNRFYSTLEQNHDIMIIKLHQKTIQERAESHEEITSSYTEEKEFSNIQKLFDYENAIEEKIKITFLYENECKFRKYHFEWDKLWSKLRVYHQPYGFWMAQKNKETDFAYPNEATRNFKFEMSEYASEEGIYPILEAKIIEPWSIIKDNKVKKNLYVNSFSEIVKPNGIKSQKSENNNLIANVWRGVIGISRKALSLETREKLSEYEVVLISRSTKAVGKLFIQDKLNLIFCYEGARQDDTHLSFQKFSLPFNRETYQKWSIYQIEKVKVHRYLLRYNALEIVFINGKSVIFEFVRNEKESFIKEIEKIQREKLSLNSSKLYRLNKVALFLENFFENKGIDPKVTEKWVKREISNLEYLIQINKAASRGIYDLSQYVVMPWVVEFKKEKEPKFRDLSKSMGGLGSEERKKIISEKYFTKDPFNPYPPFFFGTHYSSPGVVFNFLIRLSPFTEYCKHLQGGKFDIPDRLFSSLVSAWRSASHEVSDVRELIPEMYYLPEIFINIDQNNFGFTQNQEQVNHIELPPWGVNNCYFFTSQHRQLLESAEVSEKLNEWIDLIFGYKQKGKEAEENFNIYYYLTYEDYIDIDKDEDDVYIKSKEAQIVHFGQIPPQIFDKPHPKRNVHDQEMFQLKISRKIGLMNSIKEKPIGIRILGNELIICKRDEIELYSVHSDPAILQKKKKFNFEKGMQKSVTDMYFLIKKEQSGILFMEKPYFIIWGYFSNEFRIFDKNTGEINSSYHLPSQISTLYVNKKEDIIFVGLTIGVLVIYEIEYGVSDISIKKMGVEVMTAPVVSITEYDGFYAVTFGNYCSIYKVSRSFHYLTNNTTKLEIKFFRSFYNPLVLKTSFIMNSPLYSIILIDNANIRCYSINGQLIKSISHAGKHYGRFCDSQLHNVLYAIDEENIICFSIPDLRNVSIMELIGYEYIFGNYLVNKNSICEIGYGVE